MMLNVNKEKKERTDWLNGVSANTMSMDDLAQLVIYGVDECEDCHLFTKYCGVDGCTCIRSLFPHPEHYHLYLMLREMVVEIAAIAAIGKQDEL